MSLAIGDPGGATARVALGGKSCAGACDGFCVRSCSTRSFPTTAHLRCVGRGGLDALKARVPCPAGGGGEDWEGGGCAGWAIQPSFLSQHCNQPSLFTDSRW